jgi:uncharacterized protein
MSGVWGYRAELLGQRARLVRLCSASLLGGALGAGLLLWLPSEAFDAIVPALVGLGVLLVVIGPRVSRAVAARAEARGGLPDHGAAWVWPAVAGAGVYGGYFGAAQGVVLLALLGIFLDEDLQRVNAVKNVLAGIVNASAALLFIAVAHVDWWAALCIAVGSTIGGLLGASIGRRLPALALRVLIVIVGVAAIVKLL